MALAVRTHPRWISTRYAITAELGRLDEARQAFTHLALISAGSNLDGRRG